EAELVEHSQCTGDDIVEGVGHAVTLSASLNAVQVNTVQSASGASMTGTTSPARSNVATDVAMIAVVAAFIAVCAQFALPFSVNGVEFSLQVFAVLLCGAILGARRGLLAVVLYLVIGAAG